MRQLLVTLFASFVITSLSSAQPASAKPLTFAYQTPTLNGTLPLIVGIDFGFFAAEGLEVKTVFIRGGPTAIAAARIEAEAKKFGGAEKFFTRQFLLKATGQGR